MHLRLASDHTASRQGLPPIITTTVLWSLEATLADSRRRATGAVTALGDGGLVDIVVRLGEQVRTPDGRP